MWLELIIIVFTFYLMYKQISGEKIRIKTVKKVSLKKIIQHDEKLAEFDKIYVELYNNHIIELEKMRKTILACVVVLIISFLILALGIYITLAEEESLILKISVLWLICILAFWGIKITPLVNEYKAKFKRDIISNFVKLVDTRLVYKNILDNHIAKNSIKTIYENSKFDETFNNFMVDDYISGIIDDEIWRISDIHVQNIVKRKNNTYVDELFKGIFTMINIKENIPTPIKISRNTLKLSYTQNRVEMDVVDFEKYFDVYSDDKILATRILTSDVIGLLNDYCEKYGIEFEAMIIDSNMYLRFFTGEMFEPDIFKNAMDKKSLYFYYSTLIFVVELAKAINKVIEEVDF